MDPGTLRMLHVCMLAHMKKLNMSQTAEIFAREAGIGNDPSAYNPPEGFLGDWWCVFWDVYNTGIVDRSNGVQAMAESSAQGSARARAPAPAEGQAQAQAEAQSQGQVLANHGMEIDQPYVYTMGQASNQQSPNFANIMGQPILAAIRNDEQHGALPYYINANIQPGWAFPEHSSNPRHNRHTIAQSSRQSFRRINRPGTQTGRGTASNPASLRATRVMNPVTSWPHGADSMDLSALLEYFNMRLEIICSV